METHVMDYVSRKKGYDRYRCPTCGRVILLRINPYDKIVVVHGDIGAQHTGGVGGITLDGMKFNDVPEVFAEYLKGLE